MTNREFYKEEIFEIVNQGEAIAFNIKTNAIVCCGCIPCTKCKFSKQGYYCDATMSKWLKEEYEESEEGD